MHVQHDDRLARVVQPVVALIPGVPDVRGRGAAPRPRTAPRAPVEERRARKSGYAARDQRDEHQRGSERDDGSRTGSPADGQRGHDEADEERDAQPGPWERELAGHDGERQHREHDRRQRSRGHEPHQRERREPHARGGDDQCVQPRLGDRIERQHDRGEPLDALVQPIPRAGEGCERMIAGRKSTSGEAGDSKHPQHERHRERAPPEHPGGGERDRERKRQHEVADAEGR